MIRVCPGQTGYSGASHCQSWQRSVQKLGLPDAVSAIGILTITPSEASIIACDIATKSGAVEIGFLDRFTGAVVLTGDVSAVGTRSGRSPAPSVS